MSFDDDEMSVSDSKPREFVESTHGTMTYRDACGQRDIAYGGQTFVGSPISRADLVVNPSSGEVNMEISLAVDHALVQRYFRMGSPPRQILMTVRRMQLRSGEVHQVWTGYVTSMSISGHTAKFLVPSRSSQSMSRRLPTVLVDSVCQHILYDGGCQADRAAHSYAAKATFVDGGRVNVAFSVTYPGGDQWARGGELVHPASGERMTIGDQVGLQITMQAAIPELATGNDVVVVAGCKHDVADCLNIFANVVNFGGLPVMPTKNPFFPTGTGVGEVK